MLFSVSITGVRVIYSANDHPVTPIPSVETPDTGYQPSTASPVTFIA